MGQCYIQLADNIGFGKSRYCDADNNTNGRRVGFQQAAAVLAYQLGDGVTNLVSPLSTTLNVAIVASGLTFRKWIRFYYPLVGIYLIIATLIMLFAGAVGY